VILKGLAGEGRNLKKKKKGRKNHVCLNSNCFLKGKVAVEHPRAADTTPNNQPKNQTQREDVVGGVNNTKEEYDNRRLFSRPHKKGDKKKGGREIFKFTSPESHHLRRWK